MFEQICAHMFGSMAPVTARAMGPLWLVVLLATGAGCARGPRPDDALADIDGRRVRIVATARMAGEIDPCT